MSALYRHRDALASGPALFVLTALVLSLVRPVSQPLIPAGESIAIALLAPTPEPSPPAPEPQPTVSPPPQAMPRPQPPMSPPRPVAADPNPAPQTPPLPMAPPAVAPAPAPMAESAAREVPPPRSLVAPAPQVRPEYELEAAYVAKVRQMLNLSKRYPTGREASLLRPSGTVRVWLILDRGGRLLSQGIDTSSQSLLLDNAALKTVALGSYPPFPAELWPEQNQHRFHADIDFVVANG